MSSITYNPQSNYQLIIDASINFADQTGIELSNNPFANELQLSDSPDAILELLHDRERSFKGSLEGNRKLINCLTPVIHILHTFCYILGESAPFSPSKAIFVGIDVLLAAANGVSSSYDALLDLFECIGNFLQRLVIYTKIPPTHEMTDIIVKIMVELLSVLAIATKQIKEGRFKKFAKKLLGEKEVESVLQRLDRLTQDEARMTVAQTLDVVHGLVNNMKVVMDDGKASINCIREALVTMNHTANEVNKMKREQMQIYVQHWLSPPDPSTNHCFVSKERRTGSAAWFFNGSTLAKWKETGSLLWIHGKPGSGKSTLLSAIIQDIEPRCEAGLATMAYYYFDFREAEKQNRYGLLSSLLSQLCTGCDSFCDILSRLRSAHASGARKPTDSALTKCLKDILLLPCRGPIYIIIDAIDECPNTTGMPSAREEVLELLQELVDCHFRNVFVCLTSRPEIDIQTDLETLAPLQISLHDEIGQKKEIIDYINAVILSDKKMGKWRKEDRQLVIDTLSEKADGMFRWVVCQVDRLRRSFPASICSVLNDLPNGLDETYEHTLLGIDNEKREYAQRLFRCLAVSIRPLRVEELADILAVQFDPIAPPVFNADWRPTNAEEAIFSACSSLVTIVEVDGSQVVQFAHFSVKEFLTSDRLSTSSERLSYYHIDLETAHTVLAHASLTLLLQLDGNITTDITSRLPLSLYAARHWVDHAQHGDVSLHIHDSMGHLFDSERPHFSGWVWLYDIDHDWVDPMSGSNPTRPQAVPLYYASLCGLRGPVERLAISRPSDVNAIGGSHTTPLHAASVKGHLEVARLLLNHDANPNSRDNKDRSPLHLASQGGHLEVMEFLLERGAEVNSAEMNGKTPLHSASTRGNFDVVRFLLNHGADVNSRDEKGHTPLHRASYYGHIDVVRLLLDGGSNMEIRNPGGRSTLHLAMFKENLEVVELLLEHGANVNAVDDSYVTPLHISSMTGHLDVVRLLAEHGADLNATDRRFDTPRDYAMSSGNDEVAQFLLERSRHHFSHPNEDLASLHTGSKNGDLAIVRSLIECGEDVNSQDVKRQTPLFLAAGNGKSEITECLLENGANANIPDENGWEPLHIASRRGHLNVVQELLNYGVDINAQNVDGRTPLDHASSKGEVEVVRLLIMGCANLEARDRSGWTPLHRASYTGKLEVVRLLLEQGANAEAMNDEGQTPLDMALDKGNMQIADFLRTRGAVVNPPNMSNWTLLTASKKGRMDIVESLLERGEDVNVLDPHGETPLFLASYAGHFEIAKLLVRRGAKVDTKDDKGWSPLHSAALFGHLNIANMLLEHGADINAQDKQQYTPLFFASRKGRLEVVELLLQHGASAQLQNDERETPLQIALARGHHDVARLLSMVSESRS